MRPNLEKEFWGFLSRIFQRFQQFFSEILSSLVAVSGLKRKKTPRWLKLAFQTKIQLCVLPKIGENHHFRSGVVFTPKVRMKHVDRRWKSYLAGNKGKSPKSEYGATSASDCLKEKCVVVNMDK